MKNIYHKLALLFFVVLAIAQLGTSQNSVTDELHYEVNRVHPYISISNEKLKEANTIEDLNPHYKSSWVREFKSVEILTFHKGKPKTTLGNSNTLNSAQKEVMKMADAGIDIAVKVLYIPENTLSHNDVKEITFSFTVDPDKEAQFIGGYQALEQYLKDEAISGIPEGSFVNYDLAAIKFAINEEGEIIDSYVFESSKYEKIDELLLKTIQNMPCWQPAEYADGTKVKQEFALTIGNMENCIVYLLNIR